MKYHKTRRMGQSQYDVSWTHVPRSSQSSVHAEHLFASFIRVTCSIFTFTKTKPR